jgi:hypothetical protein
VSFKAGIKTKDEYVFSLYDQLEWDNDHSDIIYSEYQRLSNKDITKDYVNDVYGTVHFDNVGPIPEKCEGIECISDFVDLELLKQAMNKYGLKPPKYIIFVEPNIFYKMMQVSAWTPSMASDKIYINRYYYDTKDEIGVVEAIAHETWHLTKQPKFIRKMLAFVYEKEAGRIGESVSDLYKKMIEVKTALELSRKWK